MTPTIKQANAALGQFDGCANYLVAVGTSPVSIKHPTVSDVGKHRTLTIFNDTGADCYFGGSAVDDTGANKGIPVADQNFFPFPKTLGINQEFYAVLASDSGNLIVIAEYHGSVADEIL